MRPGNGGIRAAACVLLLLLAGCGGSDGDPESGPPPNPSIPVGVTSGSPPPPPDAITSPPSPPAAISSPPSPPAGTGPSTIVPVLTATAGQTLTAHSLAFDGRIYPVRVTVSRPRSTPVGACPLSQTKYRYAFVVDIAVEATGTLFYWGSPAPKVRASTGRTYGSYYQCAFEGRNSLQAFPAMIAQTFKPGERLADILVFEVAAPVRHGTITLAGTMLSAEEKALIFRF